MRGSGDCGVCFYHLGHPHLVRHLIKASFESAELDFWPGLDPSLSFDGHFLKGTAIELFLIQLALNAFWSILFFGLKNPFLSFGEILFLWTAIFLTILSFFKIEKWAAYLLIPYLLRASFATYLNYAVWALN